MSAVSELNEHDGLIEAQRVLALEAYALQHLQSSLDASFLQAVDIIHACQGHTIITGMGKSGHIGRKIAATLASTGTPAFFVHPAEASHGDLGMLSQDDVIVALSNSGETAELYDLLNFSRRYHLPLIAITQNPNSSLALAADTAVIIPKVEEACPLGLAPTTSTTMMLALGDAFAMTLLKYRGFSPKDFGKLHPGGKLGQRLIRVEQIMHTGDRMPLLSQNTLMQDVLIGMSTKGFGVMGFTDDAGRLVGIITDGDLRRHMSNSLLSQQAHDVMSMNPLSVPPQLLVEEALALMNDKKRTCFFVIDQVHQPHYPQGFIHIHDCLRRGWK